MTESDKSFEAYMSEEITYAGVTGKRSVIWSIPRCVLARQVWSDCMERQNVASTGKCTTVGGEKLQG